MKCLSLVALALASVAIASPEPEAAAEPIEERTYYSVSSRKNSGWRALVYLPESYFPNIR
jgi:hypothetical protein